MVKTVRSTMTGAAVVACLVVAGGTAGATGITHIVLDHDIDEDGADDENIVACMDAILYYGEDDVASAEYNEMYTAKLSDGRSAKLVWDKETNEVVTMYVEGEVSNDWAGCAETVGA